MTVSGAITYEPTVLEVITGMFNVLGIAQEGEALTPQMYTDGLRAYNGVIQTWSASPHLWTLEEGSLTLVSGQAAYTVSPRALRITSCRYNLNGIDTPMRMFSRQEYFDQPNKTVSPSIPVNFYFDPKVENGTVYLWPAPSATAAADYTINYTYVRFIDIVNDTAQTADFPQQWFEALTWNGAKRLMTQYPVNDPGLAQIVLAQAGDYEARLRQWDNEPASVYFQVDYNSWPDGR